NFIGTYLLGPILIRNPHLTEFIIKMILEKKELPYEEYQDFYETKAYQEYQKQQINENNQ
ncbi:MAG: glutamine amidotransferase, partial [Bacilli bacterium]|nr:glutamine amidotransferase [Bacilli bacterium]